MREFSNGIKLGHSPFPYSLYDAVWVDSIQVILTQ